MKKRAYHPLQQTVKKSAIVPQKVHPDRTKPLTLVQPNVIEYDKGKEPKNFQNKVHMYPSGPSIIPPEVPVTPPRVHTAQPPWVDKGGPSYNLKSRGKKNYMPIYALAEKFQKKHEANAVNYQIYGVSQEYKHPIKGPERKIWEISFANELGKLAQGIRGVKGTTTVIFIIKDQVPKDKKVTYGKIVCEVKPEKEEKERTRLTLDGNLLDFTGNLSALPASVTTENCVFNIVVSTPGARCLLDDIKNFYLNNILPDPEFMRIPLKIIPQEIIDAYDLTSLVDDQGWIYIRTEKGMYGLKQARVITNQELVNIWLHLGIILCNIHPAYGSMTAEKHVLVLWLKISVFNIAQQRMPTIF